MNTAPLYINSDAYQAALIIHSIVGHQDWFQALDDRPTICNGLIDLVDESPNHDDDLAQVKTVFPNFFY